MFINNLPLEQKKIPNEWVILVFKQEETTRPYTKKHTFCMKLKNNFICALIAKVTFTSYTFLA